MKFLNGWKTILGAAGSVAVIVGGALGKNVGVIPGVVQTLSDIGEHINAVILGGSAVLGALGIIHKAEKSKSPQ